MLKLRDYQEKLSDKGKNILDKNNFLALFMEVRTWKTITSLEIMKKFWAKKVLFVTKKKAISSINADYQHYSDTYSMQIINYESIHKITDKDFDFLVLDESHKMATFPKPNKVYRNIKKRFWSLPIMLLSWTPTPESFSQFFHQFFIQNKWVWSEYTNFYKWAKTFVKVTQFKVHWNFINDYSVANYDRIMEDIWHLIITRTQKQAWFTTEVKEKVLFVEMKPHIYSLVERLKKDKIIEWKNDEVLLADTKVKEMNKIHQLFSWTIRLECWTTKILDTTKWDFIKKTFNWRKIWIFYNFKAEKELLKRVYWANITDDLDEFNETDKNIMLQVVSGREWISLKQADFLVYYNISFSAVSYWQSRDRMTTINRKKNTIYWIFSKDSLDEDIYRAVQSKKSFTTKIYERC